MEGFYNQVGGKNIVNAFLNCKTTVRNHNITGVAAMKQHEQIMTFSTISDMAVTSADKIFSWI